MLAVLRARAFAVRADGPTLLRSFMTPLFGAEGGVQPLDVRALDARLGDTYNDGDVRARSFCDPVSTPRNPTICAPSRPLTQVVAKREALQMLSLIHI